MRNLLFFLIAIMLPAAGDPGDYTLVHSIAFPGQVKMTTDKLGNAYVLIENQLLQFGPNGKPKANFSQSNLGNLQTADAGNPLKPLLFYPDFSRLVVLDAMLSFQSSIDLREAGIQQPLAACSSEEGGYWVYDRAEEQLKKIDNNLQVIYRSNDLVQELGYRLQPVMMTENNGYLYVNDPGKGIFVFDRYGTFFKTLPVIQVMDIQVAGADLLYVSDGRFYRLNQRTGERKEILLPANETVRAARIEQNELYLLTSDSLKFYSF